MLMVRADPDRRIDLPGVGPCPRPVDIDRAKTGFTRLGSLRVYRFAAGVPIEGEAEEDEVFVVAMRGQCAITVRQGERAARFSLASQSGARAVYLPPLSAYRLEPRTECEIAYARSVPRGPVPEPGGFDAGAGTLRIFGYATGMNLGLVLAEPGQELDLSGGPLLPERFVHVRTDRPTTGAIGGEQITDWDTAVLDEGENPGWKLGSGRAEVLMISASGSAGGVMSPARTGS